MSRPRPTARIRSELSHSAILKANATMDAKRAYLAALGLSPIPAPRPEPRLRRHVARHVIRRCVGVASKRTGYVYRCNRRMLVTLVNGRPPRRCPECRVLGIYWKTLHRADPMPIIATLVLLMRKGLIGREFYMKQRRNDGPTT